MATTIALTPSARLRLEQIRDGNVKANVQKGLPTKFIVDNGETIGRVTTGLMDTLVKQGLVKRAPASFGTHTVLLTAKGSKALA